MKARKKGTKTSVFGVSGRIGHDSTPFYNSRLYEGLPQERKVEYKENPVPDEALDKIFCKSSEDMGELPDDSVHLMVTSPPYNVGKEYDENLTLTEYRNFLRRVWKETYRVLVPGGRACINVANLGRKPYIKYHLNSWSSSVWTFPAVSARKIGHPAPFSVELPYRGSFPLWSCFSVS